MKTVICFGDSNTYGYDPPVLSGGRYGPDSRWVDLLAARTAGTSATRGRTAGPSPAGRCPSRRTRTC